MKNLTSPSRRPAHGFTMIEVAISLSIVAFALVAILGVLPTGMQVQKDNREDTIVNQDGLYLLEALRSGSRGVDDLTNYVESITVSNKLRVVEWTKVSGAVLPTSLISGERIIQLLTIPREQLIGTEVITNKVTARIRAITGAAAEKSAHTNSLSFRYLVDAEVQPLFPGGHLFTNDVAAHLESKHLTNNLYDIRLRLRWPVFEQGKDFVAGRNRKNFRTIVAGRIGDYAVLEPGVFKHANFSRP